MDKWGEWCGCGVPSEADVRTEVTAVSVTDWVTWIMYHCVTHSTRYTVGMVVLSGKDRWTVTDVKWEQLKGRGSGQAGESSSAG